MKKTIEVELKGIHRDFIVKHLSNSLQNDLCEQLVLAELDSKGNVNLEISAYYLDELIGNLSNEIEDIEGQPEIEKLSQTILHILEGYENQLKV